MKYRFLSVVATAYLMVACACGTGLKNGDLVFVGENGSAFSSAIAESTSDSEGTSWVHVGIIEVHGDSIFVIEAEPRNGVRRLPLAGFVEDQDGAVLKYMRLKTAFAADEAIARAKSRIGEPYDWYYLPDNGRCYCSELVYDSYLDGEGEHIFPAEAMSFRDAAGNMPQFWVDLFSQLGCDVPEGEKGTNPDSMAESGLLYEVFIDK